MRRLLRKHRWLRLPLAVAALALVTSGAVTLALNWQVYVANLRMHHGLPAYEITGAPPKILVVAPHPDDETLPCAGLIQQTLKRGGEVYVILMTNGDASELSLLYERAFRRTPAQYLALGRTRLKETLTALGMLGVSRDHLFSLGYPNGGLDTLYLPEHWLRESPWTSPRTRVAFNPYPTSFDPDAAYCGESVVNDLARLITKLDPDTIFTTGPFDQHPDHWATWGFVNLAVEQAGWRREGAERHVYGYLVHRSDWPAPRGYLPKDSLAPPAGLTQTSYLEWYALPLDRAEVRLKTLALRAYRTQAPRWELFNLSLVRANELFAHLEERPSRSGMVMLQDPTADLPGVRARPAGDLATVAISPGPKTWRVTITTAGNIDPYLTYSVLGHGVQGGRTFAWLLTLENGMGTIQWVEGDEIFGDPAPWHASGQTLESELPASLIAGRGLIAEAYTRSGPRYLDHTVTGRVPEIPRPKPAALTPAASATPAARATPPAKPGA